VVFLQNKTRLEVWRDDEPQTMQRRFIVGGKAVPNELPSQVLFKKAITFFTSNK
jgi:hypothetical protein